MEVSPNGASVYTASGNDGSVTRFDRTAVTGALNHQGCLSRDSLAVSCTQIPGATANAFDSGFDNLRALVIAPDGTSLYTISGGDSSIAHFTRGPAGALGFVSCLTKETQTGARPARSSRGDRQRADTGWNIASNPPAMAIKPDGTGVFFGTNADDSIVHLDRAASGALMFRGCLTSETESAGGCTSLAPATSAGTNTALDQVHGLAMTSDGSSLYCDLQPFRRRRALLVRARAGGRGAGYAGPPAPVPAAKKKCKKAKRRRRARRGPLRRRSARRRKRRKGKTDA